MRSNSVGRVLTTVAALGLLGACDGAPTIPAPTPNDSAVTRVELTGPATIPPGATARFSLTAFFSDGSSRDVAQQASWRSGDMSVVTIDDGVATARAPGETTITSIYRGRGNAQHVLVLAPGTYRVAGSVREIDSTGIPLGGARVQLVGGAASLETVTDGEGRFALYGVPSDAELRVSKEGYIPHIRSLHLSDHAGLEIHLGLTVSRPDITGRYTLTIGSQDCTASAWSVPLRPDLRQRTYSAEISQTGTRAMVTVTGPAFSSNKFQGTVDPGGATFRLTQGSYYYYNVLPELTERLPDGTIITVTGSAATTLSGRNLAGTLKGSILHLGSLFITSAIGLCTSNDIPFVFSR